MKPCRKLFEQHVEDTMLSLVWCSQMGKVDSLKYFNLRKAVTEIPAVEKIYQHLKEIFTLQIPALCPINKSLQTVVIIWRARPNALARINPTAETDGIKSMQEAFHYSVRSSIHLPIPRNFRDDEPRISMSLL